MALDEPLARRSLLEVSRGLVRGEGTAREYLEELLATATRSDTNAIQALRTEAARRDAARADAERPFAPARPLAGLPFLVKANIETADLATTAGTPALAGHRPGRDAPAVQRLVDAGAIVLGTTNMDELALHITGNNAAYGPIRNPRAPGRIAGGSSGGNGAALAAGLAPFALGTDTGGSVRIPASLTGTVGFRPTIGRYPAAGVVPISTTLDTVGAMARTVADVAVVDAVVAGDPRPAGPAGGGRPRLGVPERWLAEDLDRDVERAFQATLTRLAAAGVDLVPFDLPEVCAAALEVYSIVCSFECLTALTSYLWTSGASCRVDELAARAATPAVRRSLAELVGSAGVPSAAYRRAMRVRHAMRDELARAFASRRLDAIAYPSTPLPATPLGEDDVVTLRGCPVDVLTAFIRNTLFSAVLGGPALALPMRPADPGGLPVGFELAACPGADRALLSLGTSLEGAIGG